MSGPLNIVPADLAQHAQAVVREAVSNAVRHSHATELAVTVSVADDLVIDVTDNGVGIPDTVARSGLHNLRRPGRRGRRVLQRHREPDGGTGLHVDRAVALTIAGSYGAVSESPGCSSVSAAAARAGR